jgi:hypothetical protein
MHQHLGMAWLTPVVITFVTSALSFSALLLSGCHARKSPMRGGQKPLECGKHMIRTVLFMRKLEQEHAYFWEISCGP